MQESRSSTIEAAPAGVADGRPGGASAEAGVGFYTAAAMLAAVDSETRVAEILVGPAARCLSTSCASYYRLEPGGVEIRRLAARDVPELALADMASLSIDARLPVPEAIRSQSALWFPSMASLVDAYPDVFPYSRGVTSRATAVLPLVGGGRVRGCWAFSYPAERAFEPGERALAQALAALAGQALDRLSLVQALRASERARQELLGAVAHQVRTPLTTLDLWIDRLRSLDRGTADVRLTLDRILRASGRLSELVDLMTAASELGREGGLVLEPSRTNLALLVRTVVRRQRRSLRAAGCQLRCRFEESAVGLWDRGWLEQAVGSLIGNVVTHAPGAPFILAVRQEGGQAVLEVCDGGQGIGAADRERIFTAFERGGASAEAGSLGLGLWICREVARAHGGSLTLEPPSPGRGTTFRLHLPL